MSCLLIEELQQQVNAKPFVVKVGTCADKMDWVGEIWTLAEATATQQRVLA